MGGLSNALGRDGIGYYELRGVPLNSYEEKVLTILANKEMKTLLEILNIDMINDPKDDSPNWYNIEIENNNYVINENDNLLVNNYYYDLDGLKNLNNCKISQINEVNNQIYKNQTHIKRQQKDKTMTYKVVAFGTDQDLDGIHIRGLLLGFFLRVAPNLIKEGRIKQLRTPLIILKKGNIIKHFFFTFDEYNDWCSSNSQKGLELKYMKGLGSWKQDELNQLFEKHSFEYFLDTLEWTFDANMHIHQWLSQTEIKQRKEYLMKNTFNMFKV